MANLTGRTGLGDVDRGQMILVTAFILAIAFVVLAVVVNSAIFTENLATREEVAGSQDALENRDEVERNLDRLIESVNEDASLDNSDVEASILNLSSKRGLTQASLGRVVNISYLDWEEGVRIAQDNASRSFVSNESEVEWTVAEGVSATRNLRFTITNPDDSFDFSLVADDPDMLLGSLVDRWQMDVDSDGSTMTVEVRLLEVDVDDGTITVDETAECSRDVSTSESVVIDVTSAMVDGEPCHALKRNQPTDTKFWFAERLDQYDIVFDNADDVEGTYSMIIDEGSSNYDAELHDGTSDDFPYYQDNEGIVYSVTVAYAFYTSVLGYETNIVAAPGELPP